MEKIAKFTILIGIALAISIGLFLLKNALITGAAIIDKTTFTKAICNDDNFCQDHVITCENGKLINQSPITGAVIQNDDSWEDPRNDSEKEISCQ